MLIRHIVERLRMTGEATPFPYDEMGFGIDMRLRSRGAM